MSTRFFGDVPEPKMHHGATVDEFMGYFHVSCPQCQKIISSHQSKAEAIGAATVHNVNNLIQTIMEAASPAPPPWAGLPTGPNKPAQTQAEAQSGFNWARWMVDVGVKLPE